MNKEQGLALGEMNDDRNTYFEILHSLFLVRYSLCSLFDIDLIHK